VVGSLLDNVEAIRAVDRDGMIDFAVLASKHYREAIKFAQRIVVDFPKPDNIVVSGLGGSAIGGDLLKDWARGHLKISVEVSREYNLPKYAGKKTLAIINSYSGETEETLSSFLDALERECMVFCISSGGALIKFARMHKVPHLQVPSGMPPRAALPYMLVALLILMEKIGLAKGVVDELNEAALLLEKVAKENGPETPLRDNFAKTVASHIGDSAPVIYGFGVFRSVAQRFKQQFNENSKSAAKWEFFPELDHNEIVGWEGRGEQCRFFSVIFIRDLENEPVEICSRIDVTEQIMEKAGLITFELRAQGNSTLARMVSAIVVGDFISVYLAVLRGVDPTPVKTINVLKSTLQKNGVKEKVLEKLEKFSL
jgi:glucose/mannose-6-phosphate isomerase